MGKGMEHRAGSVMVVGGGIAGIQAALDLTELGYYVYLLEKAPVVGGVMAQLDKTFPTLRYVNALVILMRTSVQPVGCVPNTVPSIFQMRTMKDWL